MSEVFDKELNAQKGVWKNFPGFTQAPASLQKSVRWKWKKQTKKKRRVRKNVIDGRKDFIGCIRKTNENNWNKLRVNDSGYNEGTICLLNGWMGAKGMVFWAWAYERAP